MTPGDHFEPAATACHEFRQEPLQLTAGEAIARRMGDDRITARGANPTHRVSKRGPLARDMARFSGHQKALEDAAQVVRCATVDQTMDRP